MTNFSALADAAGLVLHSTVTIGYDAPWRRVHELLTEAAQKTRNVSREPGPFVLQACLNDFSIAYELNVYTRYPCYYAELITELHQNIQVKFNQAGIEIMPPNFAAVRDGKQTAMPVDYLPKEPVAKGFRVVPIAGGVKAKS